MVGAWLEQTDWVAALTALTAVAILAYIAAEGAARAARLLLVATIERGTPVSFSGPIVRRPIRVVRATVFLGVCAALSLPALDLASVATPPLLSSTVVGVWLLGRGLRIALIAILTYVLIGVIAASAGRLEDEIARSTSPDMGERLKRARTLSRLVQNALTAIVVSIAGLMVLNQFQIDIMPILTGAGIVGLAVGFGAQTLVKDLIAGFFLTFENQVRVGDVAEINGTGGLVEAINLRTIVLRDLEGTVHVFPNGSVERLANRTKDFSYIVLDVGVAYKENVDTVFSVLRDIGAELAADAVHGASMLEPLEILGVDDFGESQVTIKIRIKTVPLKQWEVGRELRRRIKNSFDARGIEIPFPHLSLYVGEASKPLLVRQVDQSRARSEPG
jgi:small conductance mechanosensitive channel